MKKTIFLLILYISISNIYSQKIENKKHYNPVIAGLTSYILPGAGQMYCGETKRGLLFTGTTILGYGIAVSALTINNKSQKSTIGLLGIGLALGTHIYSIFDAVKIAKKKNNIIENKVSVKIKPFLNKALLTNNEYGLNLTLSF